METKLEDEYKAREAAMKKMMSKVDTKIGKEVKSSFNKKEDKESKAKCDLAYRIFHEGMEMYEEGDMTFKEFVEDLNKTLLAIE